MQVTEYINPPHYRDGYTLVNPIEPLQPFVDFIHVTNFEALYVNEQLTEHCFSSFGLNLLFPINHSFEIFYRGKLKKISRPTLVPRSSSIITHQHSSLKVMGVRLKVNPFFGNDSVATISESGPVALDEFLSKQMMKEIDEAEMIKDKIDIVQSVLLNVIDNGWKSACTSRYVVEALDCISQCLESKLTVQQLSNELCLTSKTLDRYFIKHTLLTPKKVFRVMRFRRSLRDYLMDRRLFDFCRFGYHDQSHFYNEIKNFTGLFPFQVYQKSLSQKPFSRTWPASKITI
jgi:AraC-like DNA-binding protein